MPAIAAFWPVGKGKPPTGINVVIAAKICVVPRVAVDIVIHRDVRDVAGIGIGEVDIGVCGYWREQEAPQRKKK